MRVYSSKRTFSVQYVSAYDERCNHTICVFFFVMWCDVMSVRIKRIQIKINNLNHVVLSLFLKCVRTILLLLLYDDSAALFTSTQIHPVGLYPFDNSVFFCGYYYLINIILVFIFTFFATYYFDNDSSMRNSFTLIFYRNFESRKKCIS